MRVRLNQELRTLNTQLRSSVFLREVIRAAAVRNSPIISMTFDKEGFILAFFPNRWKIGFPNMQLFIISVIGPAIISATIHNFFSFSVKCQAHCGRTFDNLWTCSLTKINVH